MGRSFLSNLLELSSSPFGTASYLCPAKPQRLEREAEEDAALQAKEAHVSETPSAALDRELRRGGGGRG